MRRGVLIPLFTGLLLSGCKEPTQVLVSIQTDYLQSDMPEIVVRVVTPTGEEVDDLRITRGISAPTEPPWTFGILREDDATTPLTVIATGIMNAQVVATATRSITTFEKGQLVSVSLFLARSCRNKGCGLDESCGPCGCHLNQNDPQTVCPDVTDGGVSDSGERNGDQPDGGEPDGGHVDSGQSDAGQDPGLLSWTQVFSASVTVDSFQLTADPDQIIVIGQADGDMMIGDNVPVEMSSEDSFVAALQPNGQPRWVARFGGLDSQAVRAVEVDVNGQIYIAGKTDGLSHFIPPTGTPTVSFNNRTDREHILLASFSPDGDLIFIWDRPNRRNDEAFDVLVHENQVYLAGDFDRTSSRNFCPNVPISTPEDPDGVLRAGSFVASLNTQGTCQWVVEFFSTTSPNDDPVSGRHLAMHPNGQTLFVAGMFNQNATFFGESGNITLEAPGMGAEGFIAAIDLSTQRVTRVVEIGGDGTDFIDGITVGNDELLVTGNFGSNNTRFINSNGAEPILTDSQSFIMSLVLPLSLDRVAATTVGSWTTGSGTFHVRNAAYDPIRQRFVWTGHADLAFEVEVNGVSSFYERGLSTNSTQFVLATQNAEGAIETLAVEGVLTRSDEGTMVAIGSSEGRPLLLGGLYQEGFSLYDLEIPDPPMVGSPSDVFLLALPFPQP